MTVKDPTIIVTVNNEVIVFVGTPESYVLQSDNKEYVKTVKHHMEHVEHVPLIQGMPYELFPTGKNSFLEVTAAMVSVNPGQALIVEAPEEVLKALNDVRGTPEPGAIY